MIYVRSFLFGLFAVALLVILSGLLNVLRKGLMYVSLKPPGGFEMSWDITAVRKSRVLWVLVFLILAAGFYWEFQILSN
jgi:hypothetical protein